jgi:ribosomal protein S12 methylthiotransferase accessory factor YcaO
MTYGTHKDERPAATIKYIRNILHNLGIVPVEYHWDSFGEANHSVVLADPGLGAVNGKGISREYALASAHGEFIERVQNFHLYRREYGLMKETGMEIPDQVVKDISYGAPFLGKFCPALGINPESPREIGIPTLFFPFWDVFNKKVTEIPSMLLNSSNGMCAGNTPEEALGEGICEIIERYVLSRLFFNSAALPTIPMEDIKHLGVYRLIDDIHKNGYHVIVKDMTLGGRYPVVGTLLFNKDRTKYSVRLGSSTIFETALQRCLTEIAQNSSFSDFEYKMVNFQFDFCEKLLEDRNSKDKKLLLHYYAHNNISGVGHFPADLFTEAPTDRSYRDAFEEKFKNSKQSLYFLLNLIKCLNRDLYIRDVNFLGFPAYRVYISELSCVDRMWFLEDVEDYLLFSFRTGERENILRLKSLGDDELRQLAECMQKDIASPAFSAPNMYPAAPVIPPISLKPSKAYPFRIDQIPYTLLLVLILYRLKEYRPALDYLTLTMDRKKVEYEQFSGFDLEGLRHAFKNKLSRELPLPDHAGYLFQPMFFFLKKLSAGVPKSEAEAQTAEYFGRQRTDELLDLLSMKTLGVPDCGDCSSCYLREECRYDKWKQRINAVNEPKKQNYPDQANLEKLFKDMDIHTF